LLDLMNEFYSEAGFVLDYEIVRSSFNELLNHAEFGSIFLMYLDSNPVGHAVITIRYAMEYGGFVGYIDDLFIKKEYRRLGIANCGLAALEKECERFKLKGLIVEVGESNEPAIRLYEKIGLSQITDGRVLFSKKI
nr:GNAT family N-acetyltransferase [Leptospiraceae bacterium]